MTLQVGRVTGLRPDPGWTRSGDTLTSSGVFQTTGPLKRDPAEIDVRRMQVQNLVDNPDEEFYPVRYAGDPSIDGYYRVLDSSVSALGPIRNGAGRWSITLERVHDSANPRQETAFMSGFRTPDPQFSPAITGARRFIATAPVDGTVDLDYPDGYVVRTIDSVDGPLVTLLNPTGLNSNSFAGSWRYSSTPEAHYQGGCLLEQKIGSTWWPVIGRQPVGRLTEWRISNGLVRFGTGPTVGATYIEGAYGTGLWDAPAEVCGGEGSSALATAGLAATTESLTSSTVTRAEVTILRNDPDAVVVAYDAPERFRRTFSLRRGAMCVEFVPQMTVGNLSTSNPLWRQAGLAFVDGRAFTSLAGATATNTGIESAAGANGRYVLIGGQNMRVSGSAVPVTWMFTTSVPTGLLGIGYRRIAGTNPPTELEVVHSLIGGVWAKTRLVVR